MSTSDVRELFIVGCPRSGTTWLQLLLSQSEAVATAPETQIFAYYLEYFRRQWQHEHEGPGRASQGAAGLSRLFSEEDFEELCRRSARMVLDRIAATNPTAPVVVEKSPKHALSAGFIRRLLPEARFLHLIRDPRDTVASLLAAGRSWGADWAPRSAIPAARLWRDSLHAARAVADDEILYREIRYEALRADPVAALSGITAWLGIPMTPEQCDTAVAACSLDNLRSGTSRDMPVPGEKSPAGFFRQGAVGGWRAQLTTGEIRAIEHICSAEMAELGYGRDTITRGRPFRITAFDGIQRVRESIDWQLQRLLGRI